jgi:MFS family permease
MLRMLRNRWWIVFAAVCGLIVGAGSINIFAFGVFLKPVTQDLGLGRADLGKALILNSTLTALGCPILGMLIERWGVRKVMLPGIVLFAVATAGYSFLQASPYVLIFLIFGLAGLIGAAQTPVAYATIVAKWFDRDRGLALGIAMAGVGLGVALVPQLAGALIVRFGWRMAYVGMGIAILILAFIPVAIFVRDPSAEDAAQNPLIPLDRMRRGLTTREALLKSWRFWALTVAFFLSVASINGTLTQIVALLSDRGIPIQVATAALSAAGLAIIVGRIFSGWCLDRFWGPYVAICFVVIPMIGILLLATQAGGIVPLAGAVLCGMGIGAEVDLMAFFVSRYFGLRSYPEIYGTMFAIFSIGTGFGPYLAGLSFDRWHSYNPIFLLFEIALGVTCILFLRLGPYPFPVEGSVRSPISKPA